MRTLLLIGIGIIGIAIISRIINTVFKIIGIGLLIAVLLYAYNSGFLTTDTFKGMVSPPTYNSETQEFSVDIAEYKVTGKVGTTKVNLMKGDKLVKTMELPSPVELKNNKVKITKEVVDFILKNIEALPQVGRSGNDQEPPFMEALGFLN